MSAAPPCTKCPSCCISWIHSLQLILNSGWTCLASARAKNTIVATNNFSILDNKTFDKIGEFFKAVLMFNKNFLNLYPNEK